MNYKNEEGQAIVVAIIFLIVAFILALAITFFHQQGAKTTKFHRAVSKDRLLAEAGIDRTMQKLNTDNNFSDTVANLISGQMNPFNNDASAGTINLDNGKITVVIEPYYQ